jgi:hypothetical protein
MTGTNTNGDAEDPEDARRRANRFVRNQFKKAWSAKDRETSLTEFGIALHTLQDSTSPSHANFQRWTGEETAGEVASHVLKEIINPGSDSNLYQVTRDAWKWYKSGKLPEGDLFKYQSD